MVMENKSEPIVETLEFPAAARKTVAEIRAQMISLQAQLQQFVDGVIVGMGLDIESNPQIDLDSMTITVTKKE
jgi:hypothetical protein